MISIGLIIGSVELILIGVLTYKVRCQIIEFNQLKATNRKVQDEIESNINILTEKQQLQIEILEELDKKNIEFTLVSHKLDSIQSQLEQSKILSNSAYESYCDLLEKSYEREECEYTKKLEELKASTIDEYDKIVAEKMQHVSELEASIGIMKNTIAAGNESIKKALLEQNAQRAFILQISDTDLTDAQALLELCSHFNNPRALRMVVWQSYFQKPTNELCARVNANKISGIYKITNLKNNRCYIGQSSDISSRWKQHIKCGLGIDTPVTNTLYKAMLEEGVWNFMFEVLEPCSTKQLNECEKKWIEIYEADTIGYNGNKGVSK